MSELAPPLAVHATETEQHNVVFRNQHPEESDSRAEILAGLRQKQKQINPKYFYDTYGSELFEQITQQPEYYPTRTERSILTRYAVDIAQYCGQYCVLIEPGSGSSEKVRLLLDAIKPATYVPMDIAAEFLQRSAIKLGQEFPLLNVQAICADFGRHEQAPQELPDGKRVVFYPGSTLGNMTPDLALKFLSHIRQWLNHDGGVLIGIDLHKSPDILTEAYNDRQGITARFNLNVLENLNSLMNANFETHNFSHHAFYNEKERRIEMHLISNLDHIVRIDDTAVAFAKGETIHTENSYKYSLQSFEGLVEQAGFTVSNSWLDDDELFSVHYLEVTK